MCRAVLITEYAIPANVDLSEYRPIEVWIESSKARVQQIVLRLDGPHIGGGDLYRVRIAGTGIEQFRGIWSERDGPPYVCWTAPNPIPDALTLEYEGKSVEIHRKNQ